MTSSTRSIPVTPAIGIDISYWCNDHMNNLKKDDGDKVKHFEVHTINPWILSIDRDDDISIYDFSKKSKIFQSSLSLLLSSALESSNNNNNVHNASKHTPYNYNSIIYNNKLPSYRSSPMFKYYNNNTNYDNIINNKPLTNDTNMTENTINNAFTDNKNILVKYIGFADNSITISSSTNQRCNSEDFTTYGKIIILCNNCILIHDIYSNHTNVIHASDLQHKNPTSIEFICDTICVIGCSDGIVRFWECDRWSEVKQLHGHSKGDILAVKCLPILIRYHTVLYIMHNITLHVSNIYSYNMYV